MLFFRSHVPHQIVNEFFTFFHVLGGLCLVLETNHVVGHLEDERPGGVVVLGGVAHLHGVLQVQPLCRLLKLLPAL